MEMVVCSGVAIRLCRDKAWKITIHLRQGYGGQAENAPFSDPKKSFQAFLKTFEITSINKNLKKSLFQKSIILYSNMTETPVF